MKVICKENRATNLDFNEVTILNSRETIFPITKEKEYIVMGIKIRKDSNCIYYLVDDGAPFWLPYVLFDISNNELSPNWFIEIINKKESTGDIFYLSGFDELCNNEDYYDALVDRERWALEIYYKRKIEVENWYSDKYWLSL